MRGFLAWLDAADVDGADADTDLVDDAGKPFASAHILRHTFGTNLLRSGIDVVVVAQLMGHRRLDTTGLYITRKGQPWVSVPKLEIPPEPKNLAALKAEVQRRWGTIDLLDFLKTPRS